MEDLFPELLQDMLPESPRARVERKRSSQDPQEEIENSRQYKQMPNKTNTFSVKLVNSCEDIFVINIFGNNCMHKLYSSNYITC